MERILTALERIRKDAEAASVDLDEATLLAAEPDGAMLVCYLLPALIVLLQGVLAVLLRGWNAVEGRLVAMSGPWPCRTPSRSDHRLAFARWLYQNGYLRG